MDQQKNVLNMPVAIIIAGVIIAGALVWNKQPSAAPQTDTGNAEEVREIELAPVTENDHILGNPNAQIKIVEYSDTECPFCKVFHTTMQRLMNEYGKDGKIAWVYRHLPIQELHTKARKEAEALECAAELGGNNKFWDYTNKLYQTTNSNDSLDPAMLPTIATQVGLDRKKFEECLASGKWASKVEEQYQDGVRATGGRPGTPFSVIITKNGAKLPINGAQPYQVVKTLIDTVINQNQ
jgi:protein-disulfide isomerase